MLALIIGPMQQLELAAAVPILGPAWTVEASIEQSASLALRPTLRFTIEMRFSSSLPRRYTPRDFYFNRALTQFGLYCEAIRKLIGKSEQSRELFCLEKFMARERRGEILRSEFFVLHFLIFVIFY